MIEEAIKETITPQEDIPTVKDELIEQAVQSEEQTIQPIIDEEKAQLEAQAMNVTPVDIAEPIKGSETASIGSVAIKEAGMKASDFTAWANREIFKTKEIIAPKKPLDMMLPKAQTVVEEQSQQVERIFTQMEKGNAPKFNSFSPTKEALGLVDSDVNQFDDSLSHVINFNTISNQEDLGGVLGYMAEQNKKNIDFMRRGVVGDEQLRKLADDLGSDPQMIIDVLSREAGGAIPPAEYIVAIRQTLDQSATKLKELADKVVNNGNPMDTVEFSKQFDFHRKFQSSFMGIRAEYGRGLRAMGITQKETSDNLLEILGAIENNLDVNKLAETISKAESTKGINAQVSGYGSVYKYGADVFFTNYMASMLSGLSTQVLNIGGSIANMSANLAEKKMASWLPKGGSALDEVQSDEVTASLLGYRVAFGDAMKVAWKTLTTGEMYKGMDSMSYAVETPKPSEFFKQTGAFGKFMDGAFATIQFPIKNVMGGTDAFFTHLNEKSEMISLAYRDAKSKLNNGDLAPQDFKAYLQSTLESPSEELKTKASSFAKSISYKEKAGEISTKASSLVNAVPTGRFVVPFIKTMSNIATQTLVDRTPFAPLSQKFRDDFIAGGARRQLAESKMAMGIGYLTMAYGLAENDMLTPPLPKDQATRELWKANGIKPLSVVFTDEETGQKTYVPHVGLEPFSSLMGIMASVKEYQKKSEYVDFSADEEKAYNDLMGNMLFAVSDNVLSKPFGTGLQSFMESVNSPKAFSKMISMATNTAIPYAGLRRNIVKELDDVKRSTQGVFEYVQSQLPLLTENLPPVLDIFGEEMKHDYVWLRWSPSQETTDPVRREFENLHEATKRMAGRDFRDLIGGQLSKPEDIAMWKKYARKDYTDSQGRNVHDALSDIIQGEGYQNLTSIQKVDLIGTVFRKFDMGALKALAKDNPELYLKLHNTDVVKKAYYNLEKLNMTREEALQEAKSELMGGL